MALKLGLTPQKLLSIERGFPTDFYTIFRIANYLNINIGDLVSGNSVEEVNLETSRPLSEFVQKYHLTYEEQKMLAVLGKALFRYRWGTHTEQKLLKSLTSQFKMGE
jgi:transcriptional regulator with XRE-family HTH domain